MMKQAKKTNLAKTTILVLLICGIVGVALSAALFFGNPSPTYASATLAFTFDGAADGIAPNGVAFDLRDMLLDEVLAEGLEGASLEGKYTPEKIRPSLVVSGIYPEDMADQVMHYESLLNFTASRELTIGTYHATTFQVALHNDFDRSISKAQLSSLLKSILEAYCARFAQVYAYGLDAAISLFILDDYDYPQQLQIVEEHLASLSAYAQELYEDDPTFRLGGAGFNDINVRLRNLVDSNIRHLEAEIAINALTKDPARLLTQYQYEIRSLSNQRDKQKQALDNMDKLISTYEKNEIIYLQTSDALTKIDGNSSETYDILMARRKEIANDITNINHQIATYELLISDLLKDDTAQAQPATTPVGVEEEGATSTEIVAAMTEEELAAAAAEAERASNAQRMQLEESLRALVAESERILADFKVMLQAYNAQKINDLTVSVIKYDFQRPSLLSGAFIKHTIKTAGPLVALGFMACVVLIIVRRRKEDGLLEA